MRTRKNRKAGVIAPFSYNDLPRHIENTNYVDCLAQCFYGLGYINLENAKYLQTITKINGGIYQSQVVNMLNDAYYNIHFWIDIPFQVSNSLSIRPKKKVASTLRKKHLDQKIDFAKDILKPREATLCYIESKYVGHYVIVFRNGDGDIIIHDPQNLVTMFMKDYFKKKDIRSISYLNHVYDQPFEPYQVTRAIIDKHIDYDKNYESQEFNYNNYDDPRNIT